MGKNPELLDNVAEYRVGEAASTENRIVIANESNLLQKLRNTAVAGASALALIGGYKAYDAITDTIPSFDNINVPAISLEPIEDVLITETGPSVVVAGVDHESYDVEQTLNVFCYQQISATVGVTGEKDGGSFLRFIPLGDGQLDKKYFVDFLLCNEEQLELDVTESVDPITQRVQQVTVTLPSLEVFHPRVDELDIRNCADISADATPDEVENGLQEFAENYANDKKYCDDGFNISSAGSDDTAELTASGRTAAQLATLLNAAPLELINQVNENRIKQVIAELQKNPAYADATMNVTIKDGPLQDEASIRAKLDEYAFGDMQLIDSVAFDTNEQGNNVMRVTTFTGDELTVLLDIATQMSADRFFISEGGR